MCTAKTFLMGSSFFMFCWAVGPFSFRPLHFSCSDGFFWFYMGSVFVGRFLWYFWYFSRCVKFSLADPQCCSLRSISLFLFTFSANSFQFAPSRLFRSFFLFRWVFSHCSCLHWAVSFSSFLMSEKNFSSIA